MKSVIPHATRAATRATELTLYTRSLLTRRVMLPMSALGKQMHQTMEREVAHQYEGRCILEGFVKTGSTRVVTYTSGLVEGDQVQFEVVFECSVCHPVEGMLLPCVVKNVTKAGVRAESATEAPSPVVIFVARDHYFHQPLFSQLQEGDTFTARVIGQRFELNDKYISILAEWLPPRSSAAAAVV